MAFHYWHLRNMPHNTPIADKNQPKYIGNTVPCKILTVQLVEILKTFLTASSP